MSKAKGKTITTYLIEGNPNGLRSVFISNKTCKALVSPRSSIDKIKDREEVLRPSIYFLLNNDDNKIYVGESENFYNRIKHHLKTKDFWDYAISFVSQNNDLTKVDVKYLEYLSISEINNIGNVSLDENNQIPSCPNLPEHQKATIDEFFEDIKFIMSFLGYSFFTPTKQSAKQTTFYCTRNGIEAKGFYDGSNFVVLKGSLIWETEKESYKLSLKRLELQKNNKLEKLGNFFITKQDFTFSSPSSASSFCVGASSNGWTNWKDKNGNTLDELIRKKAK
jgi:hypothetical protein